MKRLAWLILMALSGTSSAALPRVELRAPLLPASGPAVPALGFAAPPAAPMPGLGAAPAPTLTAAPDLPGDGGARSVRPEDVAAIASVMTGPAGRDLHPTVYNAAFTLAEQAQKEVLSHYSSPEMFITLLQNLYAALRRAHEAELPIGARTASSALLHDQLGVFLERVAKDESLPVLTRDEARRARDRDLTDQRLLSALAWGRQEKDRIAQARRALIDERIPPEPGGPAVGADQIAVGWRPPAADARPPEKGDLGVWRYAQGLKDITRGFQEAFSVFQLAQNRHDVALKAGLPPASISRETDRWHRAARAFAGGLDAHGYHTDYILDHTLRMWFSDAAIRGKPVHIPDNPNLSLHKTTNGYLITARFETRIQEPAVVDAFRRSLESYWTGRFEEDGASRRVETHVDVRVLAPGEKSSPDALFLEDGVTTSGANGRQIMLRRDFDFFTPAHEFGHVLGLPDEYVNDFDPENLMIVNELDLPSLMGNHGGLVQARHLAQVVALLREGGRLQTD